MKRNYLIITIVIFVIIGFNLFFFNLIKKSQIDFQKKILIQQTELCGSYLEQFISEYESDLNRIIFKHIHDIHSIFSNNKIMERINNDLKSFYSKYQQLVSNISVYDTKNKYLGIYLNDHNEFVIDTFSRQKTNQLQPKDIIIERNGVYYNYFPFFKNDQLKGNIVVQMNLRKYLDHVFQLYRIEDIQWQWLINKSEKIIYSNADKEVTFVNIKTFSDSLEQAGIKLIEHEIIKANSIKIAKAPEVINSIMASESFIIREITSPNG